MALSKLFRRWHEARTLQRHAIPDTVWQGVMGAYPFLRARSDADLAALRRQVSLFLSCKEFTGMQDLVVDDAMAVAIAAQACLPILYLDVGLTAYSNMVGIVVQPGEVIARREVMDEDGVVHAYNEPLTGEAMAGGPVMLAWSDVAAAGAATYPAYNVVIHEFAHVLDMATGTADGVPPHSDALGAQAWTQTLDATYTAFCDRVDAGEQTLLDPYGAESVVEFFAVATEAFFVAATGFRHEYPGLYRMFSAYFRQDPAQPS